MWKWIWIVLILLASPSWAAEKTLTFQWNGNTEVDIAGYKLYQGTAAGGPYTLVLSIPHVAGGGTQSSPLAITVPSGTDTTLYWVLSAYDTSGNESGYSNEVSARIDFKPPGNPQQFIIKITTP